MTDDAARDHSPAATLTVTPRHALVDERVQIQLSDLAPQHEITLHARMDDDLNGRWESHATFVSDRRGAVDVATQRPLSGTYADADPMGLFWSMTLDAVMPVSPRFSKTSVSPTPMILTASVDGAPVASATLERRFVAPDVTRMPVREHGLVGTLFLPGGPPSPAPGVMVMGGSGGGLVETTAGLLASHGFAALALAYFAYDGLPDGLVDIPLEYFETAIHWMQGHERLRNDGLAVMGTSRGGELVLLLGATFPQVTAVVGNVPSAVVFGGLSREESGGAAWTYRGKPLTFVPSRDDPAPEQPADGEPIALTPGFLRALQDRAAVERSAIPVERIQGPILLISGQDDQMWPSSLFADMVVERLAAHHHPYPYQHLSYPGAGHLIGAPYLPTSVLASQHPLSDMVFAYGGNAKDSAFAQADSWPKVLAFLRQRLTAGSG
jgi:dienelactone hydrolase